MALAAGSPAGGLGSFVAAAVLALLVGTGLAAMSFRNREPMRILAFAGIAVSWLPAGLFVLAVADFTLPL